MSEFKRRVTVEQLDELTDEQKQKLREWWRPEVGDYYNCECGVKSRADINTAVVDFYEHASPHDEDCCLPLLDIGQMIQLLITHGKAVRFPCDMRVPGATVDTLWESVKCALMDKT
jgi:hypothetical protein